MKQILWQSALWCAGLALMLAFVFYASTAHAATIDPDTITDTERVAAVAGLVMGLDMAMALDGRPLMRPEQWAQLTNIFTEVVRDCRTISCITDHIVKLRESVRRQHTEKRGPGPIPLTYERMR